MAVYIAINRYNRLTDGGDLAQMPATHHNLLQRYRHHIEQDIPYIDAAYNPWQS